MTNTIAASAPAIEAHRRGAALRRRISLLLSPSKISESCKRTLLRLVDAELRFLSRQSPSSNPSTNLGYLESVAAFLQRPSVSSVSLVCKPVGRSVGSSVHVDVVCTVGRRVAWVLVSARNPRYVSWNKGVRARVTEVVEGARKAGPLRPETVVLVFRSGVGEDVVGGLVEEFSAVEIGGCEFHDLEGGWVDVVFDKCSPRVFEVEVGVEPGCSGECADNGLQVELGSEEYDKCSLENDLFFSVVSGMSDGIGMVNFDTTALIALVSGISNGATRKLVDAPEIEMRKRFKGNYGFVMAQVTSELENPILMEFKVAITGKKGIICESVRQEFMELVSMCGGPKEKCRANYLLDKLKIMPDCPSARIMALPTTRKIAMKNKIVFGTGDYWRAPTLTANMGFVRAISQTGMSLLTIEHKPRALTGD